MCNVTLWHICLSTAAMEMQQCIPYVLLSYMPQYKNIAQKHFYGKFMLLTTRKHT